MRVITFLLVLIFLLSSCKNDKQTEASLQNLPIEEVKDDYISIDSNIKLIDSIIIDNFAYKFDNNDSLKNLNLKIDISKESMPKLSKFKDLNLFILLYPKDSLQISKLPKDYQKLGFDNWSVYDIQRYNNFVDNAIIYSVDTKIFEFYKVEMGLYDKKENIRFGTPYVLNDVFFKKK